MKLSDIQIGDTVKFYCNRLKEHKYRTVRGYTPGGVVIYYNRIPMALPLGLIVGHRKRDERGKDGITELSREMSSKGITNIKAAERSGYCVRTICDARTGQKVKESTLTDIWETVRGWQS